MDIFGLIVNPFVNTAKMSQYLNLHKVLKVAKQNFCFRTREFEDFEHKVQNLGDLAFQSWHFVFKYWNFLKKLLNLHSVVKGLV